MTEIDCWVRKHRLIRNQTLDRLSNFKGAAYWVILVALKGFCEAKRAIFQDTDEGETEANQNLVLFERICTERQKLQYKYNHFIFITSKLVSRARRLGIPEAFIKLLIRKDKQQLNGWGEL